MLEGRIIKALSGFYYVKSDGKIYQCKGRGVFRNRNITPLVGDFVTFDIDENKEGYISTIKERTNELVRPPIANINQAIIVCSAAMPDFSSTLLDRFLVLIESKNIKPIIFITKMDLISQAEAVEIEHIKQEYEQIGYDVELISSKDSLELDQLKPYFKGNVTVIAGQSGVGKSTLLNTLNPNLLLQTAAISKSLGRGKHTTRHVELIEIHDGLVADTPGFSSLDFSEIDLDEIADCFPEFRVRKDQCKFRGCMHHKEPKCAIKEALRQKEIPQYRYDHYVSFLEEIQTRKPRY